jgi:hypothetical protein
LRKLLEPGAANFIVAPLMTGADGVRLIRKTTDVAAGRQFLWKGNAHGFD